MPIRSAELLERLLDFLALVSASSNEALVPVRKVRSGPTPQSVVVRYQVEELADEGTSRTVARTKTVPASTVVDGEAGAAVPRWVLKDSLSEDQRLVGATWSGFAAVAEQIRSAYAVVQAKQLRAQEEAEAARRQAVDAKAEKERERAAKYAGWLKNIEEDGEFALAFARRRLTLSALRELGVHLPGWPTWQPGDQLEHLPAGLLSNMVDAVRRHPDFARWKERNRDKAGTLLKK